ncbi:MAG TPA: hypothetical protein VK449_08055 [Anaerolineales bacterium]|nr:hypothetical protein [Anaerolineales bacterium]
MTALPRPDRERLSALGALVLLAFTLVRVVDLPTLPFEFTAAGLLIQIEVNRAAVFVCLAAAVTVAGADWLARSHPRGVQGRARLEHVIIPGLATLATGAILTRLEPGPSLWVGLALAAGLLMAVLLAEFIVVDPEDPRRMAALIGLTVLAQILLTGVYFALLSLQVRAIFCIPLAFAATAAVAWRLLRLRLPETHEAPYAVAVGAGIAELMWGLYYLPLSAIQPALILGLLAYLAVQTTVSLLRGRLTRARLAEYAAVAALGTIGVLLLA